MNDHKKIQIENLINDNAELRVQNAELLEALKIIVEIGYRNNHKIQFVKESDYTTKYGILKIAQLAIKKAES